MSSAIGMSNWSRLKGKVASTKPKKDQIILQSKAHESADDLSKKARLSYVGLDCEMVGIGPDGTQSALARCCLVDYDGSVLYDQYVRPPGFVTDFRTRYSGIRKRDLREGTAVSLAECQAAVAAMLKDKVLVGHALKNDLDVLMLSHPRTMIRDTAKYRPYMRVHGKHGKIRPRALRDLAKEYLGLDIQTGEHDPGEDARCAMMLYRAARSEWEQQLKDLKLAAKVKATTVSAPVMVESKAQVRVAEVVAAEGKVESASTVKSQTATVVRQRSGSGLSRGPSVDVEVAVLGAEDSEGEQAGGPNHEEDHSGNGHPTELAEDSFVGSGITGKRGHGELPGMNSSVAVKKRKVSSHSGNITSRSSKNHKSVDARLAAAKEVGLAHAEAQAAKRGGAGRTAGGGSGMFAAGAVIATAGRSISEVDREMQAKKNRAKKHMPRA